MAEFTNATVSCEQLEAEDRWQALEPQEREQIIKLLRRAHGREPKREAYRVAADLLERMGRWK